MLPCAVCGDPTTAGIDLACTTCATPHHPDCWRFAGGCSRFGCGDQVSRALAGEDARAGALSIHADSATATPRVAFLPALWRRLKGPAHVLPRTLATGLGGALLGTFLLLAFGVVTLGETFALQALLGSALLHGLLAPYLSPSMHRAPLRTALGAGLLFLGLSASLAGAPLGPSLLHLPLFAAILGSCMIASASLAEAVLGPRSWLGQRFGGASLPGRVLLTWAAATVLWLLHVTGLSGFPGLTWGFLQSVGLITLVIALSASPALERGKAEFRGWLPRS